MSQTNRYSRKTGPEVTLKLWQIFESKDQFPNEQQLIQELCQQLSQISNKSVNEDKCHHIVNNALDDKLLAFEDNTTRSGLMRIKSSYNRFTFGDLSNDWFCFECDSCEENLSLLDCQTCFRAFHLKCLESDVSEVFRCEYCLKVENSDKSLKINRLNRKSMNQMFGIVLNNFENSVDNFDIYSEYEMDSNYMTNVLIFKAMDLNTIKSKIESEDYNNVEELDNDFKHFMHNFIVYRIDGLHPEFEDFLEKNISFLKDCYECFKNFYNSNRTTIKDDWFLRVCDPPHPLVYARVNQNLPFLPAKVIRQISEDRLCIQFFNSPEPSFERSVVNRLSVKPIDFKFSSKKYRNSDFKESLAPLSRHMKILIDSGIDPNNEYTNALNFFKSIRLLNPFDRKVKFASKLENVSKKLKTSNRQVIPNDSDQQNPKKLKSKPNKGLNQTNEEKANKDNGQEMDASDDLNLFIAGPSTLNSFIKGNAKSVSFNVSVKPKQLKSRSLPKLNPNLLAKMDKKIGPIGSQTNNSSNLMVNRGDVTRAQTPKPKEELFATFLKDEQIEGKDKFQIYSLVMKLSIVQQKYANNPNN